MVANEVPKGEKPELEEEKQQGFFKRALVYILNQFPTMSDWQDWFNSLHNFLAETLKLSEISELLKQAGDILSASPLQVFDGICLLIAEALRFIPLLANFIYGKIRSGASFLKKATTAPELVSATFSLILTLLIVTAIIIAAVVPEIAAVMLVLWMTLALGRILVRVLPALFSYSNLKQNTKEETDAQVGLTMDFVNMAVGMMAFTGALLFVISPYASLATGLMLGAITLGFGFLFLKTALVYSVEDIGKMIISGVVFLGAMTAAVVVLALSPALILSGIVIAAGFIIKKLFFTEQIKPLVEEEKVAPLLIESSEIESESDKNLELSQELEAKKDNDPQNKEKKDFLKNLDKALVHCDGHAEDPKILTTTSHIKSEEEEEKEGEGEGPKTPKLE